jgi:hypothetical protein
MPGTSAYKPKLKRRKPPPSTQAARCPKCDRALDPGKYHDCGDQPSLFAELNGP